MHIVRNKYGFFAGLLIILKNLFRPIKAEQFRLNRNRNKLSIKSFKKVKKMYIFYFI